MITPKRRSAKKERRPFQHMKRNPFSQSYPNSNSTDNFPGLDEAFQQSTCNSSSSSSKKKQLMSSPDRLSSIAPSSILDMSIGARAAMTEHTRYISKHGLDGNNSFVNSSHHGNENDYNTSHSSSSPHVVLNRTAEDEWDRVMDGGTNMSQVSFSSTYIAESESNYLPNSISSHTNLPSQSFHSYTHPYRTTNLSTIVNENEPMNDDTLHNTTLDGSDFFNSSRVAMLATPEKNKAKVDEASRLARLGHVPIGKRGGMNHSEFSSASVSGSTSGTSDLETSGMIGLFNAAMKFGEKDDIVKDRNGGNSDENDIHDDDEDEDAEGSFISYHEPNLSIIRSDGKSSSNKDKSSSNGEFFEDEMGNDLHQESSFISYRDPDLSTFLHPHDGHDVLSSDKKSCADFEVGSDVLFPSSPMSRVEKYKREMWSSSGDDRKNTRRSSSPSPTKSDFRLDMSEIRAPSDFDQGYAIISPKRNGKMFSFATPQKKHGSTVGAGSTTGSSYFPDEDTHTFADISPDQKEEHRNGTNSIQENFPLQSHLQRSLNTRGKSSHFLVNKGSSDACGSSEVDSDSYTPHFDHSSVQKDQSHSNNEPNFSALSPITNRRHESPVSPGSKDGSLFCTTLTDIQPQNVSITPPMLPNMKHRNGNSSTSSTFHLQRTKNDGKLNKQAGSTNGALRHRSRLGERYFNADRFEDSYVVPACSMSTTCTSATTDFSEKIEDDDNDRSVAKSLLQTFESAHFNNLNLCVYNTGNSPKRIELR